MNDGPERDDDEALDPLTEARREIAPDARVCGNCLIWKPSHQDDAGRWVGPCRLMHGRGDLYATSAVCDRFLPRGSRIPTAAPEAPSRRRAVRHQGPLVRRRPEEGAPRVSALRDLDTELGDVLAMTKQELLDLLSEFFGEGPPPALAHKWEGGTVLLQPGDRELQPKEIPLETFFKKVIRVREQLRVLEQKINAQGKLSDAEKVELQTYITRSYGALTTFNVLFRDADDRFRGQGGKE